jgi:hypothetical protein
VFSSYFLRPSNSKNFISRPFARYLDQLRLSLNAYINEMVSIHSICRVEVLNSNRANNFLLQRLTECLVTILAARLTCVLLVLVELQKFCL